MGNHFTNNHTINRIYNNEMLKQKNLENDHEVH